MSTKQELEAEIYAHIKEPEVEKIYKRLMTEPYKSFVLSQEYLDKAEDKLSVLHAMEQAVKLILEDLAEHGKENEELYGNHGKTYFNEELKKLTTQIEQLEKSGATSEVYAEYEKKRKASKEKIYEAKDEERRELNVERIDAGLKDYTDMLKKAGVEKLIQKDVPSSDYEILLNVARGTFETAIDAKNIEALKKIIMTLDISDIEAYGKKHPYDTLPKEVLTQIKAAQEILG